MLDTTEDKAALALTILGFAILAGVGYSAAGAAGAVLMLIVYVVYAIISVILGVAAAFLTAALLKTSFGLFGSAVLRLAGIIVFTSGVSVAGLPMGWLLSVFIYGGLLMWLFELELMEVIVFTIILWVINFLAAIALLAMLGMALGAA